MRYFVLLNIFIIFSSLSSSAQQSSNKRTLDSLGAWNAVKKAHQMADLPIEPMKDFQSFPKDKGIYKKGEHYKGVIYSSVKETNTFVGTDVSFHTFMTALHNPRSIIYTDKTDAFPYHGVNCRSYYGTVCSGLITYALGFKVTQRSADILTGENFELIKNQSAKGIKVADLICRNGHPALITGIEKDKSGRISRIEVCSARERGCCRYYIDGEKAFDKRLKKYNLQIYRYKHLDKNTMYVPANEFVAVCGEKKKSFKYNNDICANRGDKSCYVQGDDIILNVFQNGDKVEIYKDSKLYKVININQRDTNLILKGYHYGDYKARVITNGIQSDFTYWKIIDTTVRIDKKQNRIYFSSKNAEPVYYEFCNIAGSRPTNKNRIYAAEFTKDEKELGYVSVTPPKSPITGNTGFTYVKVHFECDYGMVINRPIDWHQ